MKRLVVLVAFLLLLAGCSGGQPSEKEELIVFAASSLTEPLLELEAAYEQTHPGVDIVYNFDSSGTLQTQIQAGAPCDVFLSAAQKQMDALEVQGLLQEGSRFDWLKNRVVLLTPQGNPSGVESFEDLSKKSVHLVAVGNADVPAGQYAREILTELGIWDTLRQEGKLTYGSNVKEVVAQVEVGAVDCGIVYGTDAISAGLPVAAVAPDDTHAPVIYPAAVLKQGTSAEAGEGFLAYLRGENGLTVLKAYGFTME